jgi:transcriptional regulator with XRE-family HTH domain
MKDKRRLWLKSKRAAMGLDQKDVCKELDIPLSTYACYEIGTRNPTPQNAIKLSKFFEVPMEKFY